MMRVWRRIAFLLCVGTLVETTGLQAAKDPQFLWHRKIGYCEKPAVADVNGDNCLDLVVGSEDGHVYVLSGATGDTLWLFEVRGAVSTCPAVADVNGDGRLEIVAGTAEGKVYAIAGATGKQRWRFDAVGGVVSSPVLCCVGDKDRTEVVVCDASGRVTLLSGRSGKGVWVAKIGTSISATAAVGDVNDDGKVEIVAVTDSGDLFVLDGSKGRTLYSQSVGLGGARSPMLADVNGDGVPEILCAAGTLVCLVRVRSGWKTLWEFAPPGREAIVSEVVAADLTATGQLTVLVTAQNGNLWFVDAKSGKALRSARIAERGAMPTSPAVADLDGDGSLDIAVASWDNALVAVSGQTGERLWDLPFTSLVRCSPLVADINGDGKLEVTVSCKDGELFVYMLPVAGKVVWGKFRGDPMNAGSLVQARRFGQVLSPKGTPAR